MEQVFPYIFLTGLALVGLGFVVLLVVAFRTRFWWGLVVFVFPPAGLVFILRHPRTSLVPSTILFLGVLMAAGPPAVSRLLPVDLGPRERMVDGELNLTLTGWDRKDYSVLRQKSHAVVVQMANPDVDDRTLDYLSGMYRLRELDLNHTKVTDAGLSKLQAIATLESLKLSDTSVTDAGFRQAISAMTSLRQLDLRGTRISRELVQAWKDGKPGRRALQ